MIFHTHDGVHADTLVASEQRSWSNEGHTFQLRNVIQEGNRLRRLAPVEAERLQGFPDDWTVGDGKRIVHDKHRLRLLGNAVSPVVSEWLGKRFNAMMHMQHL